MEADEVVHLFIAPGPALLAATPAEALPRRSLKGFARVTVKPGQHQTLQLPLSSKDFQYAALGEAWSSHSCYSSCLTLLLPVVYGGKNIPPLFHGFLTALIVTQQNQH